MNARYFKDQICDELDGACDYLKRALDCFSVHPSWAVQFIEMAEMEQGHATTLYKMFMEMYTEDGGKDRYLSQLRDNIMDCFSSKMRKIEDLKSTFALMEHKSHTEDEDVVWDTK